MRRFDEAAAGLVMGETVRITMTGHEPRGVRAVVHGLETVGASVAKLGYPKQELDGDADA